MFDWLLDILSGKDLVKAGYLCWNALSDMAMSVLGSTPSDMAGGSLWNLSMTLMGIMKVVGASLFNLLFFMNFCKHTSNLRDNQTMETVITMFIKLLIGNLVVVNIDKIVNGLSAISQDFFQIVVPEGAASVQLQVTAVDDWDNDSILLGALLGAVFLIICIGAGLLLVLHVYGIFLKVFFYIVTGPLALSTIPGPEGAARSAENWLKTMVCTLGEFAGTALMLRFSAAMINTNRFLIPVPPDLLWIESAWNIIQSMMVVLLVIGSVKAVDSMLRRAFGF